MFSSPERIFNSGGRDDSPPATRCSERTPRTAGPQAGAAARGYGAAALRFGGRARRVFSRKPKNILEGNTIKDLPGVRADRQLRCESDLEMRHSAVAVLEAALHQARRLTSR